MRTRLKFLLLSLSSTAGLFLLFHLAWTSESFRRERNWYHAFPFPAEQRQVTATVFDQPTATVRPPPASPASIAQAPLVETVAAKVTAPSASEAPSLQQPAAPDRSPVLTVEPLYTDSIDSVSASAPKQPEEDWYTFAAAGYRLLQQGNHDAAVRQFEKALVVNPGHTNLKLQLGYSYLKLHRNNRAATWFAAAIRDLDRDAPFTLRRQFEELNNRWAVDGYLVYRDQRKEFGPLTGPNLVQSQAGMELSWQPPHIGYNNGRKLALYGRILWALEEESLRFNDSSYQGGIGIRYKPLAGHNLVLSAERLLEVGRFARNDWMLRAGYSLDHQTDWQPDQQWWSGSLYLDAALIRPDDPDIYLTFQAQGGYVLRISERFLLRPGAILQASWQKDRFHEAHLAEAGPGLKISFYFNETRLEAWRSRLDLSLDYRFRFAGNSLGESGPVVSLLFHF